MRGTLFEKSRTKGYSRRSSLVYRARLSSTSRVLLGILLVIGCLVLFLNRRNVSRHADWDRELSSSSSKSTSGRDSQKTALVDDLRDLFKAFGLLDNIILNENLPKFANAVAEDVCFGAFAQPHTAVPHTGAATTAINRSGQTPCRTIHVRHIPSCKLSKNQVMLITVK